MIFQTPVNENIVSENIMVHDYPDGQINMRYLGQSLDYSVFDKLERINQGEIVENKRLDAVLRLAMAEPERLESESLRERSCSDTPRRQEQRRQSQMNPATYDIVKEQSSITSYQLRDVTYCYTWWCFPPNIDLCTILFSTSPKKFN